MTELTASLRSDNCPSKIGIGVRYESESLSDFIGIRSLGSPSSIGGFGAMDSELAD